MPSNVFDLDDEIFDKKIKEGAALVDFWADWCMPCRFIGPIVEQLSEEYTGKINFYRLNVDKNREVASRFNILGIPTLIFFKDGNELDRIVGVQPMENIKEKLDTMI